MAGDRNSNTNSGSATGSSTASGTTASHVHNYEWITLTAPTATQDGQEAYRCTECGYSPEGYGVTPIAAYPYFVKESIKKIEKAPLNSTVTISSAIYGSVPVSVMETIAARPDLTVDFALTYNHETYKIEIPAGTTINTEFEYYGSLKLAELYGRVAD